MGKRETGKGLQGFVDGGMISWKVVMEDVIGKKVCSKDLREFESTPHRS